MNRKKAFCILHSAYGPFVKIISTGLGKRIRKSKVFEKNIFDCGIKSEAVYAAKEKSLSARNLKGYFKKKLGYTTCIISICIAQNELGK